MIRFVRRTSLLCPLVYGTALRQRLSVSAHALMFYNPDSSGRTKPPTEYPLSVHVRDGMKLLPGEFAKFKEEVIWALRCDHFAQRQHGDYEVAWKFDTREMIDSWVVTSDKDNDEGNSTAEFVMTPSRHGLFQGCLDATVPKDGTTKRTGYCNIRSPPNFVRWYLCKNIC